MPNKILQKSHLSRLTISKEYKYPWHSSETIEVLFTHNNNTGCYSNLTFRKIKGGGAFGGNYICMEQGDEYRISKH